MLKIELIRFEAQDVITTSVATPVVPETPETPDPVVYTCDCSLADKCHPERDANKHEVHPGGGPANNYTCPGNEVTGLHYCSKVQ